MDTTLIVVTLFSLAMAVAMGIVAWRLVRLERRRSAARVSLLAELANRERATQSTRGVPDAVRVEHASPVRPTDPHAPPLFRATSTAPTGWARALAVAVTLTVATVLVVWQFAARTSEGGAVPLELTSLAHDRQGDLIRITGLVQNPAAGNEQRDLMAVAFLFDATGRLIANGRAPLEFARLAPGDESPFVIVVERASGVARYRLGFRARDGRVLTHVDRRADSSVNQRSTVRSADPAADVDRVRQP